MSRKIPSELSVRHGLCNPIGGMADPLPLFAGVKGIRDGVRTDPSLPKAIIAGFSTSRRKGHKENSIKIAYGAIGKAESDGSH